MSFFTVSSSAKNPTSSEGYLGAKGAQVEERGYCIAMLTIFVLGYYILNLGFYARFEATVVPHGDPFTYAATYFRLLDNLKVSYLGTVFNILAGRSDWYWLTDLAIALFYPFLIKEPFSLCMINFFMYWLATLSFFRLGRVLGASCGVSFLVGMLVWVFPVNYGFATFSSVPMMGLDSMFSGAVYVAIAHALIFAVEPGKRVNALLAGLTFGVAVWGRGNSILVVGMVAFVPIIFVMWALFQTRSKTLFVNLLIFTFVAVLLTGYFYFANWSGLKGYYAHHATMTVMEDWKWANARAWVLNIPGFFFWRHEDSMLSMGLSAFFHLFVLVTFFLAIKKSSSLERDIGEHFKLLAVTGTFIYFVTYGVNIIFFTPEMTNLNNVLLIYRPMLCGIILCFIIWLKFFFSRFQLVFNRSMMLPALMGMWVFASFFTKYQLPVHVKERPSVRTMQSFSTGVDEILKGGTLSVPWYSFYNHQIIDYYRLKEDLKANIIHKGKHWKYMWDGLDFSEESRKKVREEILDHFENASAIIIPEYLDSYYQRNPYPLYRFRDEIAIYLNAPDSPKFRIMQTLTDHPGARIMVLQRESLAGEEGKPLPLPYGFRSSKAGASVATTSIKLDNFPDRLTVRNAKFETSSEKSSDGHVAIKLIENFGQKDMHSLLGSFSVKPDHTYKISMWVKSSGRSFFRLQLHDKYSTTGVILNGGMVSKQGSFDTGTWGDKKAVSVINASVEEAGSGWYKIHFEGKVDANEDRVYFQLILAAGNGLLNYSGDGKSGVLFSGIKME